MKKTDTTGKMIGKKIEIKEAKNKSLKGISGIIVDESKNMITLKTDGKEKKIIKSQVEIQIR